MSITVHRNRTNKLQVSFGYDISQDTMVSEIRMGQDQDTGLIATWQVSFKTDGTDGDLVLTLDDSVTKGITQPIGYMDIKRITGGEPIQMIENPVLVTFKGVVTK